MPPLAYLTRTESFSAAHRLHSPHLSAEDNLALYGRCNNPNGHGHNYKVHVTIKGKVDYKTGMVLNVSVLKSAMGRVLAEVDHKHLDLDVPWFRGEDELDPSELDSSSSEAPVPRASTTEHLALFFWTRMLRELSKETEWTSNPSLKLYEVRIEETEKNAVIYRGEEAD